MSNDDLGHSSMIDFDKDSGHYIFQCPNCGGIVQVEQGQLNCRIFRHGYFFVKTGPKSDELVLTTQMNPHESKEVCDQLVQDNKVIGCAKPFRVVERDGLKIVETCGYI